MNSSPQSDDREERDTILVIRLSSLGDILLTAPTVRAIRRRFPFAQIDFLVATEFSAAVSLIPEIDRLLLFDRRKGISELLRVRNEISKKYSVIVDLQNSWRSAFLRTFAFPTLWFKAKRYRLRRWLLVNLKWNTYRSTIPVPLRYLDAVAEIGCEDDELGLELHLPSETNSIDSLPANKSQKQLALLCPGARHFTKRWPTENWSELAKRLTERGFAVSILGSPSEQLIAQEIANAASADVLTDLTVPQVAALMNRAAIVVSNDSGLMHLAAGLNRPLVAIFGPTVAEFGFMPFRAHSEIAQNELECRPCSAMGSDVCPKGHFRCMKLTTPEGVLVAAEKLVAQDT